MMTKEDYKDLAATLRRYAKMHEQPPFGRAIEGEEELEQQAAEAIEELLDALDKHTNSLRVETPLGAIIARQSTYGPEYPGINIDLRRTDADQDLALALVEFTDDEADVGSAIITRVYGDAMEDEYTDRVVHTGIEDFFKTE